MTPTTTRYQLMQPQEAQEVRTFLARSGFMFSQELEFPTVVAWRSGKIVGVLSTRSDPSYVIAGPLAVRVKGNRAVVALRLGEAYERVLRMAGVQWYVFQVSKDNEWPQVAERKWNAKPYAEDDDSYWYRREVA